MGELAFFVALWFLSPRRLLQEFSDVCMIPVNIKGIQNWVSFNCARRFCIYIWLEG